MKKEELDLSLIKENDIDKTAAFEDLMTRSERRKYKKDKELKIEETVEFKTEDLMEHISEGKKAEEKIEEKEEKAKEMKEKEKEEKNKKKKKDKKKNKKDKKEEVIEDEKENKKEEVVEKVNELELTKQLAELTTNDEMQMIDIEKDDKKISVVNNIFLFLFTLATFGYFIYSNVSNLINDDDISLINNILISSIVFLYCIVMITTKKLHVVASFLAYILIIIFTAVNALIYFDII